MTLPDHIRRQVRLASEANIIKGAAEADEAMSIEIAQCQIDGILNAMVRLRGVREAAEYAFALSDRVASGLPPPSDFRALEAETDEAATNPVATDKSDLLDLIIPGSRWWIYLFGLTHGAALALWLKWWWS